MWEGAEVHRSAGLGEVDGVGVELGEEKTGRRVRSRQLFVGEMEVSTRYGARQVAQDVYSYQYQYSGRAGRRELTVEVKIGSIFDRTRPIQSIHRRRAILARFNDIEAIWSESRDGDELVEVSIKVPTSEHRGERSFSCYRRQSRPHTDVHGRTLDREDNAVDEMTDSRCQVTVETTNSSNDLQRQISTDSEIDDETHSNIPRMHRRTPRDSYLSLDIHSSLSLLLDARVDLTLLEVPILIRDAHESPAPREGDASLEFEVSKGVGDGERDAGLDEGVEESFLARSLGEVEFSDSFDGPQRRREL